MYTVMIVDDEKYIRKSIINRIEWDKYGLAVEMEASNGEEALLLLDQVCPDIILVDIRMPVMDGLAFITEAKKRHYHSHFVIISAHSDFNYAKNAIQLGVDDYVLKPVEEEELGTILKRIVHKLNEQRLRKQVKRIGHEMEENLIFHGDKLQSLAFFFIDEYEMENEIKDIINKEIAQISAQIAVYYLKEYTRSDCYVYLISGADVLDNIGHQLVTKVLEELEEKDGIAAYSEVMLCGEYGKAVKQSIQKLKRKMFYPEKKIMCCSMLLIKDDVDKSDQIRERLGYIHQRITKKDYDRIALELKDLIRIVIRKEKSNEMIEEFIHDILMLLKRMLIGQEDNMECNILFHKLQSKDYILSYKCSDALVCNLDEIVSQTLNRLQEIENKDVIYSVKQYIQKNYSDNLSTVDIAQRFFLNASYLSTLFKEKTGINLTNYIEGIRMEEAKRFLESNIWCITEIAMQTGYSDSNYFAKVFKKYTGMTPKQYRDNIKAVDKG